MQCFGSSIIFGTMQGLTKGSATLWRLWSEQNPFEPNQASLREQFFKATGRRISSGGELISFFFAVEDFARSETAAYAYRTGFGALTFDVVLTPQTTIHLCCSISGRFKGSRLGRKLNGKRCSREAAYSAIRRSTEGTYSFEGKPGAMAWEDRLAAPMR